MLFLSKLKSLLISFSIITDITKVIVRMETKLNGKIGKRKINPNITFEKTSDLAKLYLVSNLQLFIIP